jgi:hypothetical protein
MLNVKRMLLSQSTRIKGHSGANLVRRVVVDDDRGHGLVLPPPPERGKGVK